jgi:hypothetical protein
MTYSNFSQRVVSMNRLQEVLRSNLSKYNDCPGWNFPCYYSDNPNKFQESILHYIKTTASFHVPSNPFFTATHSFEATLSEVIK